MPELAANTTIQDKPKSAESSSAWTLPTVGLLKHCPMHPVHITTKPKMVDNFFSCFNETRAVDDFEDNRIA